MRSAKQLARKLAVLPSDSAYIETLVQTAEVVEKKTAGLSVFTRLMREAIRLVKSMSPMEVAEILSSKNDARLLVELARRPEVVAELVPLDIEKESEYTQPEVVSTLAMLRGLAGRQELIEAAGGTLTSQQVSKLLGLTRQAVHKKTKNRELLALSSGRRGNVYPALQFTKKGKILEGLDQVLQAIDQDTWQTLIFLLESQVDLDNKTPIEALRQGNIEKVVSAARAYGEQGGN